MNSRLKTLGLFAVLLFLSSTIVLSSNMIAMTAENKIVTQSMPASTTGLGTRLTPVSILVYNQFSDLGEEVANTIEAIGRTYGPQFEYENLTDYTMLASKLSGRDIFLIPELEDASMLNVTTIGSAWAGTLSSFVQNGGNIIILDHRTGSLDAPGAHLYNESGLMSFIGVGSYYIGGGLTTAYLANSSNALGQGLPASFSPSNGMISIQTTDGIVVVDDGTDAIVVQKIMGKGNIVYLGFDYFAATTEIDTIFGNAIRLHRHIVFDDSHGQGYELNDELSTLAEDLIDMRFAVSEIKSFSYDYITACDVLVIAYAGVTYTVEETNFIEDFVESGGSLLVMSDYGNFGDEQDIVLERFGYVRNKTAELYDSDDYLGGNLFWIPFEGPNLHNHSATLDVTRVEIYAGAGFVELPANAFTLISTDDDGTASFEGTMDANNTAVSAVSTYGSGRVGVIGDTSASNDALDADSDGTNNYLENREFFLNLLRWLSAGGIEEKRVLFDASHSYNYWIKGGGSYRGFVDLLTENGYTVFWMDAFYPSFMDGMDILVIEDGTLNYTESEIDAIEDFVESGGGLLLLAGYGSYGLQADMVGNRFGLDLNNTGYLIDTDDYLVSNFYVAYDTANFGIHPIMSGVDRLELYYSTAFISIGAATALVRTDSDGTSDWIGGFSADGLSVMAAKTHQFGRLVFCGDYRFLTYNQDPDGDSIYNLYEQDNSVFILNSLYWLSENRAPIVEVTFPNGGELLNGTVTVTWTALDYDSDTLHYSLSYSLNGSVWTSLATGLTTKSYSWNTTLVEDGTQYLIRVIATDGKATGTDDSDGAFTIDNVPETTGDGFPIDPTLLLIVAGVVLVVIILIVVVKKRGK